MVNSCFSITQVFWYLFFQSVIWKHSFDLAWSVIPQLQSKARVAIIFSAFRQYQWYVVWNIVEKCSNKSRFVYCKTFTVIWIKHSYHEINTRMTEGPGGVVVSILDRQSKDWSLIPGCTQPIFQSLLFSFHITLYNCSKD